MTLNLKLHNSTNEKFLASLIMIAKQIVIKSKFDEDCQTMIKPIISYTFITTSVPFYLSLASLKMN
jgi:hypothetical protein